MYERKFVVRCKRKIVAAAWVRPTETLEWTGDAWVKHGGRRYDEKADADAAVAAAAKERPAGATWPVVESEAYLPSAEAGRQRELPGVTSMRVLPGGASKSTDVRDNQTSDSRPIPRGPYAQPPQ